MQKDRLEVTSLKRNFYILLIIKEKRNQLPSGGLRCDQIVEKFYRILKKNEYVAACESIVEIDFK